jgi:agmatinase
MTPGMYGPDITFAGVPRTTLDALAEGGFDVVFVGAPFDGGTSHRPGTRSGPQAIRETDYLPHHASRPHLALGVDPLRELRVADLGDVVMPPGARQRPGPARPATGVAVARGALTP